ncbi:hypothetical protein A2715_05875 [Candidatus Woesebacteria bacterium RIFCSPHIGHO2_01_FULL_39_32]|uniref:Hemolysin-type calcium-binding protein n=2 Tax=Candidatus Woeseibacteriota TaxID=1752722 RepID=A0A0G0PUX7_9BACT|nr:MAG: Hemolysin-type calcium-binding protein [Candidatus Woesebacteria bacterium GW2011_GWA1_39_8]OGM25545.1 MAG: hypothetical protein A2715_05875 [Candidatus Woesebacteria bacterium RIFCSPHIGHO2_01_FULL_39_32]OGM36825.1 MAG: hypothetical protein A3F01_00350 [Candidatus Woesebacteria bacterium RIFCSPHIGHO2_12_FULL_38_11]OGM65076.1 MAG: hypothetical protein A2893_05485 [Candidatus Woesebacteria bacterium RIFCSPLOWO2_01_FULL_39_25]
MKNLIKKYYINSFKKSSEQVLFSTFQHRAVEFTKKRFLLFLLLPFVFYGFYFVYSQHNSRGVETYAVDPLIVTYTPEGPPPNPPMFVVTNMLPGDEKQKDFNVKNDSGEDESVTMDFVKTDEYKAFAGILDVEVTELTSTLIFSGKLQALFDAPLFNLGNFPAGADKSYRVKVKFPSSAGNEYQEARVIFNIIWQTDAPGIELPPECQHLSGVITSVIEGTEGNDNINGTIANEFILAKGGNDRIDSNGGHDCVVGGEGNDRIYSGSGDDVDLGGNGNDRIRSGSGNDKVWGGTGNDDIDVGSGNDLAYGNEGEDDIDGGDGDDEIYGGSENDEIRGGSGNDKLYGEAGDDKIRGNSGDDLLDGGLDLDNLRGNSGTDTCIGGETTSSCEL